MKGRLFSLVLGAVFVFLMVCPAWCSVEGEWDVTGKSTMKVKFEGFPSERETSYFDDQFIFYTDSTFEMIDLEGAWNQEKRKFYVNIDGSDLEEAFSYSFEEGFGVPVDTEVVTFTFSGTENAASNKITGKIKMKMNIYIHYYDLYGTFEVTSKFTGYRAYSGTSAFDSEGRDGTFDAFADKVGQMIKQSIQLPSE